MRRAILRHGERGTRAILGSARGWGEVEADGDAREIGRRRRVALHDKRIMTGNDVRGRISESKKQVEAFEHFRNFVHHGEWAALFEIIVEMCGVGGEDDPAATRPDAGALQTRGMSADAVHGQARREFVVATMKHRFFGVDVANHLEDVVEIKGRSKLAMAHGAAGGERHLAILQMEARLGEAIEIAGVVVMEVRDDHVRNAIGIDADKPQRIDRVTNPFAAAANGCFVGEASIKHEGGIAAARDPDEVVEVGGELVRIGGDEIFARVAISKMAVADGEDFKRFDGQASLFAGGISNAA